MSTSTASRKFANAKREATANSHRSALRAHALAAPQVQAVIKMFPANVRKDVYVSVLGYSDSVYFQLTLRDLDSLRSDKRLVRVLEAFAGEGWAASSSDYTYNVPNRDYRFTRKLALPLPENAHSRWLIKHYYMHEHDALTVEIQIVINAYVKEDSPTCRIEVVERKERVVVDEVKRIVCA